MKKLFILVAFVCSCMFASAQTIEMSALEIHHLEHVSFCADTVILYADSLCPLSQWDHDGILIDNLYQNVITTDNEGHWMYADVCNGDPETGGVISIEFWITLSPTAEPLRAPFEETVECGSGQVEIYAYEGEEIEGLSVQWNDGDTSFSRFVGEGEWTATVSDTCGRQVQNVWHVAQDWGVQSLTEDGVAVYPNPAHGAFTVRGEGTLVIYNSVGQVVRNGLLEDNETTIEGLPAGMYFVQVGGNVPQKVVVVE